MKNLARKNIINITPYRPGKPIEEVERELGLTNVIKLASNESPYGPSADVVRAIAKAAKNLNRYPEGSCFYLRRKLARKLGVAENQLVFGCGSDEIIVLAIRAFVEADEEVIIATPTFLVYEIAAKVAGVRIKLVPLKDYRYNLAAMKKVVTKKTKLIFIANPDNPTGSYVTAREVAAFMKGLRKDVIVFFDEAYQELIDKKDYPDSVRFLRQGRNVIIARTFSKVYGLAGLRIGYGISKPEIIDYLNRVREPFNVTSLAQVAALKSLDDSARVRKLRALITKEKKFICANLDAMGFCYVPSATNFILINVGTDSTLVANALMREGVIVRDMKAWGFDTFIRVTIGTPQENKRFIRTLRRMA